MNREAAYAGVFAKLAAIPGLVTKSRILRHWNDVAPEEQPALFLAQTAQQAVTRTGEATQWRLRADIYLYVRTDGVTPPGTLLNPILDAIEAAFPLHPVTGQHMLDVSGVAWARIDGDIETDEGTLGAQAVAIVPVTILAT